VIKAVIFDYGGVVTSGGAKGLSYSLAEKMGLDNDVAFGLIQSAWEKLVRGNISEAEFWQEVGQKNGRMIPDNLRHIWNSWEDMRPRPEIVELITSLKADHIVVGLLSNTLSITSKDIRAHGGYDWFDPCILSYQVGYAKPDAEIYKILLASLPSIQPDEILFVDDQARCMPPARQLGIRTLIATEPAEIIAGVRKALIW